MAEVQVLYAATAQGLAQLVNPGTSHRWRPVDRALEGQDVLCVRASLVEPLFVLAGTAAGLYATRNGGASWEPQRGDIVRTLAAVEDGSFYAGTGDGIILHGGSEGWNEVHTGSAPVVYLSKLAGGRIAAVFRDGVVAILEDGEWKFADMFVPSASRVVSSVARPAELIFTNETSLVTRYGARTVPGEPTGALVLLAGDPEVLLIGTRDGIQRTDDTGKTLQAVDGPKNVRVLVSPPRYQDYAYAGTGGGELWVSTDRGRTWQKIHEGLAPVHDLSFARVR